MTQNYVNQNLWLNLPLSYDLKRTRLAKHIAMFGNHDIFSPMLQVLHHRILVFFGVNSGTKNPFGSRSYCFIPMKVPPTAREVNFRDMKVQRTTNQYLQDEWFDCSCNCTRAYVWDFWTFPTFPMEFPGDHYGGTIIHGWQIKCWVVRNITLEPTLTFRYVIPSFCFYNLHGAYGGSWNPLQQLHSTSSQPTLEQRIMFRGDLESRIKLG